MRLQHDRNQPVFDGIAPRALAAVTPFPLPGAGTTTRPLVTPDRVVVTCTNRAFGVDRATGRQVWAADRALGYNFAPVLAPDHACFYVGVERGIHAIRADDGRRAWKGEVWSALYPYAPARAGSWLLLAGKFGVEHLSSSEGQTARFGEFTKLPGAGRPAIGGLGPDGWRRYHVGAGRKVYTRSTDPQARRWAWQVGVSGAAFDPACDDTSVAVLARGRSHQDPYRLHVLDAATGVERWSSLTPTPKSYTPGCIVAGGLVLVPGHTTLDAWDVATGAPRWSIPETTSVAVCGDTVYAMGFRQLRALDLATGAVVSEIAVPTDAEIYRSNITVCDGELWFSGKDALYRVTEQATA